MFIIDYYGKFKLFSKTNKIIFVIASVIVLSSNVYIIALLSSFLDAILYILTFYTVFVFLPYDNFKYINQDTFLFDENRKDITQ